LQIIDAIPTLAQSARPDGSADFFNWRRLECTGLPAEQALNWGWKLAIHPDDLPHVLEMFQEALHLGRSFEVEGRFRHFDGEFRRFLFRGSPLLDESGKVIRWYGTNTDIEDRKRAALVHNHKCLNDTRLLDLLPIALEKGVGEDLCLYAVHVDGGMQGVLPVRIDLLHRSDTVGLDELALAETLGIGAHAEVGLPKEKWLWRSELGPLAFR
jgi:PAS domain S-box-containing protein